jgi:hypothetical protein
MKKSLAVVAIATLLLGFAFGGEISLTLRFDRSLLSLGEQDGYTTVKYALAPAIDQLGVPSLPELPLHVVIPPTATVTSVEVTDLVEQPLTGTYNVLPGQIGRQWRKDDPVPPFVAPNQDIYGSSAVFPKNVANYQVTGYKGGFRVSGLLAYPVRYSPAQQQLLFVSRAVVKVRYEENSVPEIRQFPVQNALLGSDLARMVANPSDLRRFAPQTRRNGAFSPFLPAGYYEHVIVSPAVYADSFNQLRDWRTLQGIPSTIMTIENICGLYSGRDTAEKIRNFIKDADTAWGTCFVFMPRRDVPAKEYRDAYVSYSGTDELPCDLYFSDLDGSWDGNHNNTFGECPGDSITGYADVYVGFIPLDDAGQVHNFLSKLFRYERTPGANYVEKVTLPMGVTFSENFAESIAVNDPTNWLDYRAYVSRGVPDQAWRDSINAGYGFSAGIHHGDVDDVYHGSPALLSVSQALAMTNTKLGVFISVGCEPGGWDEVGSTNGDCLAENAVVRAPNAFVAIMMNARSGWIEVAEFYNYFFMYEIMPPTTPNCSNYAYVGQGLARAKDHWIPRWNLGGDSSRFRWEAYERNLFGEPAMPLWTKEPANLTASHPGVVTIGSGIPYTVTVNTAQDAPVEDALVLCWKGSEVYTKGRTNSSGQVTLYVSPVTPGSMILTVNAHNYFLFVDTVHVISTDRYVSYLRSTINDASPGGNGDSILNPGETVEVPLWVKNWGQQTANSVTARLLTHDANAQITDSMKTFGNVAAGESAWTGSDGYDLQVNSGLSNGYAIACSLICKDELDSTWVSNVTFYVGTPVLNNNGVTVKDSTHGNGNGKIDPGETSELEVELKNAGMGHGYNCWALLRSGDTRFTIDDSVSDYGYIPKGGTANNSAHRFLVTASGSIPMETPITCTLYAYADGGYVSAPQAFTIVVGEMRTVDPIPDGPRTPALYYAYDDVDAGYPGQPTYNWVEINSIGTQLSYPQNDTVLVENLPSAFGPFKFYGQRYTQISISADGWICPGNYTTQYFTNTELPNSNTPPGMICGNWDDLNPAPDGVGYIYWYHDTLNHRLVVEWDSVGYWSQSSVQDKFEIILYDSTLATPSGDNPILVQYKTAAGYSSSTLGIEDPGRTIAIQALYNASYNRGCAPIAAGRAIAYVTTDPTGIAEDGNLATILANNQFRAYPNPFRGMGNVAWSVKTAGKVTLKVFDPAGRVIRNLVESSMKPGRYAVTWDGKANDGRTVSAGIYFYKLETATDKLEQKVVVTR